MPVKSKHDIPVSEELIREFTGEDVLCLHAICQPLTDQMQAVIRHQRAQLDCAAEVMSYSLRRQGNNLLGTQQFTDVTRMIAEITGENVDTVRESFIEGSSKIHKGEEE